MRIGLAAILILATAASCSRGGPLTATGGGPPSVVTKENFLEDVRPELDDDVLHRPPSLEERMVLSDAFGELMARIGNGPLAPGLAGRFAGTGLRLDTLDGGNLVVLREEDAWRGAGAYVIRTGEADEVLVQAPHGYHDRHTAEISWAAFERSRARAYYVNTAHRYRGAPEHRKRSRTIHRADLAHATDTYYYLLTDLLLKSRPRTTIVQLHGFDDSDKRDQKRFDVILSNGTEEVDDVLTAWRDRFATVFGARVAVYPTDVKRFAATSNTIGRLVRLTGRGAFVHVELSAALRKKLLDDPRPMVSVFQR